MKLSFRFALCAVQCRILWFEYLSVNICEALWPTNGLWIQLLQVWGLPRASWRIWFNPYRWYARVFHWCNDMQCVHVSCQTSSRHIGISAYHISFMLLSSTSPTKSIAGIHWNFFFTIAVVSLVSTTTDSWPRIIQILRVSHSVSLSTWMNEWTSRCYRCYQSLPVTTSQQLFWTLFSHTRHDATHVPFSYFFLLFRNCLCVTSDFSLPSRLHCPASRTSPQKLPLPVLHLCLEHTSPGLKHRLATSCCEFEAHQFIIIHHNSSNS